MTLPRATISAIKAKLNNAISAKDPHGIAAAVDLPPLPKRAATSFTGNGSSQHGEYLIKVDGVDWSNALNPLLDAHLAIQSVGGSTPIFLTFDKFQSFADI